MAAVFWSQIPAKFRQFLNSTAIDILTKSKHIVGSVLRQTLTEVIKMTLGGYLCYLPCLVDEETAQVT